MATDVLDMLRADRSKAELQREQNRRDFPECARVMDLLAWASPRVVYVEENGKRAGKEESLPWVPWVETELPKRKKAA